MGRRGSLAAAFLCLALVAAACGGSDDDETTGQGGPQGTQREGTPVTGGALIDLQNFGSSGEPDHIDPGLAHTIQGSQPGQLIFDGLTETDYKTGELKPSVAESWRSNPDATQWVFTLRRTTFSNGDPVLPSDFKFAWERVASKAFASEVAYHITDNLNIKGAKEVNEGTATEISGVVANDSAMTLTVDLNAPLSFMPAVVSHLVFSPVPKRVVQALPDQTKWEQGIMIGNGPYKMAEPWRHDQYIKLERNDTYWGGLNNHKAYIDTIEFRIFKDQDSAFAAFESGAGQTAYVPSGRVGEAKTRYAGRIADNATNGIYYWGFNMDDPVVGGQANVKLRQAIALAINKKQIVDTVYSGARKVATGWTPPVMPGAREGLFQYAAFDLNRAKQVLGEWERATGKRAADLAPIKLNFGAGAGHEPVATIIQANLKDLGVPAVLDPSESRTYFTRMRRGEGQFLRAGWIADYMAYDNMLFPTMGSSQARTGDNLVQYKNPRFDALIDQARRTTDENRRNELYRNAEAMALNDDTIAVPLNWYAGQVVYSEKLKNVIQSPLQFFSYDEMWLTR